MRDLNYFYFYDKRVLLAVQKLRFETYKTKLPGGVQDIYNAAVTNNSFCIKLLEHSGKEHVLPA